MKSISLFIFTLVFSTLCFSNNDSLKKSLVKDSVKDPLINEIVKFDPVKDHHFNLEAPQECGIDSTIDKTAKAITCQFHTEGPRKVRLSVCDNAKKYCKQELIDITTRNKKSGIPRIKTSPLSETVAMQNKTNKLLMGDFKEMSPDEAYQAASLKKAVLVMVSAAWCPPCNLLKEFFLPTKSFKSATKDLLLVYVDGDKPSSDAWKPILKSRFYPTFVVLNKDLKVISLFTGDIKKSVVDIKKSFEFLDDPIESVLSRVDGRLNGSLFQKAKDLFTSNETLISDERRALSYFENRGQFDKKIDYMKRLSSKKYKKQILEDTILASAYGFSVAKNEDLTEAEKKTKKENDLRNLLDQSIDDEEIYELGLMSFCELTEENNQSSNDCVLYSKKFIGQLEKNKSSIDKTAKSLLESAFYNNSKAKVYKKLLFDKKTADNFSDLCFEDYNKLYAFSPLKEKSRAVRFQQLYCLKNKSNQKKDKLKLLLSLSKDYPYEETFQRKLSSYYLKAKDFKKAKSHNNKALRYSYGAMWAYNMGAKADILQAEKKYDEAISVLDEAISEIVLEKEGRSANTIKSLRFRLNALKKKIKTS